MCNRNYSEIENWNVSNVETMESMFCKAESFNQDIINWDIDNKDEPKNENILVKCTVTKNLPK